MTARKHRSASGPSGTVLRASGKDGPQRLVSSGGRWTDEAAAVFLEHLAASCNVTWSAAQAGFTEMTAYYHRRRDSAFARRWQEALAEGCLRLEIELVGTALDYLGGRETGSPRPIKDMTVKEAINILGMHRRTVEAGAPARCSRPRSLDEVRDSILRKLEIIDRARKASAEWEGDSPGAPAGGAPTSAKPRLPTRFVLSVE